MFTRTLLAACLLCIDLGCGRGRSPVHELVAPAATAATQEVTPKTQPPQEAEAISNAFAQTADAIRPSVVRLDVELKADPERLAQEEGGSPGGPADPDDLLRRFFQEFGDRLQPTTPTPVRGTGSGVLLDSQGRIITNSHVVRGASRVTIILSDGRRFDGKVIGSDPFTDVGVVQFAKRPDNLTVARLGDSGALRVGQWVLAVGSPLGLDQTVTAGIVSGLGHTGGRMRLSGERVRRYIQTDALINPGNSGGPLVNLRGEVVGINTVINVGPGGSYGLAIPIRQVSEVANTIVKEGRVRYPYLGVMIGDLSDLQPEDRAKIGKNLPDKGVVVTDLAPGGPAAQAGLKPGDVITKIGGKPVENASSVVDLVSGQPIGQKVKVEFERDGHAGSVEVKLGEMPNPDQAGGGEGGSLGITLQPLTAPLARSLGVDPHVKGAVVSDVNPDGPAAKAGLRAGDIIREVNRKPVSSVEEATQAIHAAGGKPVLLRVTSAAGTRYVTVPAG
jgi:serine protease Do